MISIAARTQLIADEGTRQHVYDDATGMPIGPGSIVKGNPTIGVGRNVGPSGPGISSAEALNLLNGDLDRIERALNGAVPSWVKWPAIARDVACMVAFNCGVDGFLTFRRMIDAIESGDLAAAAAELMDSKAARELPDRYSRMSMALRRGAWT